MEVKGVIRDAEKEQPLPGAIVSLSIGETGLIENSQSIDGSFRYEVPERTQPQEDDILTCTVKKKGYQSQTSTYRITRGDVELDVELTKEKINWKRFFKVLLIAVAAELILILLAYLIIWFVYFFGPNPPVIYSFQAKYKGAYLETPDSRVIPKDDEVIFEWDSDDGQTVTFVEGATEEPVNDSGTKASKPEVTTLYELRLTGKDGQLVKRSINIAVMPPPVITGFIADPVAIKPFDVAQLQWTTQSTEALYITEGPEDPKLTNEAIERARKNGAGSHSVSAGSGGEEDALNPDFQLGQPEKNMLSGQASVSPLETTEYTLVAVNRFGKKAVSTFKLNVLVAPEVISFTAERESVNKGESTILYWETQNAEQVLLNDIKTGNNYSAEVAPDKTTTYVLKVKNSEGERQKSLTIAVPEPDVSTLSPPEIHSFLVSPLKVAYGQSVRLTWVTENAGTVTINGMPSLKSAAFPVRPQGSLEFCPLVNMTVQLKAVNPELKSKNTVTRSREIEVRSRSTVILYSLENFKGDKLEFTEGAAQIGFLENRVSSIEIIGNCSVRVYSAPDYKASHQDFDKSVSTLRGTWIGNNTISSLKILLKMNGNYKEAAEKKTSDEKASGDSSKENSENGDSGNSKDNAKGKS